MDKFFAWCLLFCVPLTCRDGVTVQTVCDGVVQAMALYAVPVVFSIWEYISSPGSSRKLSVIATLVNQERYDDALKIANMGINQSWCLFGTGHYISDQETK